MTSPTPTSLAPTTIGPTSLAPTSIDLGIDIEVDPIYIYVSMGQSVYTYNEAAEPNPELNTYYRPDPIEIVLSVEGYNLNVGLEADTVDLVISLHHTLDIGQVVSPDSLDLEVTLHFTGITVGSGKSNFVKWSKIGYLDFTIDESNVAGERPMDWKGAVYNILKLNDRLMVYGANGVTAMKPADVHWGMSTVYRIGLVNKGAVAGDDKAHFFVDRLKQLWMVTDTLTKLDYSEFLLQMTGTIILTYDIEKKLLYICDGTLGFVFGVESKSFGEGPENITGIGAQGGIFYVVSAGEIDTPKFEICTDIYDFGTRKPKTIQSLEVSSDLGESLYASVDYRTSYRDEFKTIGWFLVNPSGKTFPKCYGVEFRFRLMSTIYEYFELDYLKVRGHIHGYSYLDSLGSEQ